MEHYWFSSILISSKQGTDINRNLIPQMLLQRILLPTLLFLLLLHNKQPRSVAQSLDKGIRHRVCFDWTRWSYFQQILRRSRLSGEIHKSCLILAKRNDDISFPPASNRLLLFWFFNELEQRSNKALLC